MREASVDKTELAVFDLDGTCIDGQSGLLISTYLLARHSLGPIDSIRLIWWGIRYKLHLPHRQEESREIIFGSLTRRHPDEIDQILCDFHDEVLLTRYRPEALAEIERRREEGMVTLLVSATFHEVARCAARHLGVDDFIATEMEKNEDGLYTGRVDGPVIAGIEKLRAVMKWADERFGPRRWLIATAYGDHHSDADLLTASLEPFAVCPDKTLGALADRRGWTILEWSQAPESSEGTGGPGNSESLAGAGDLEDVDDPEGPDDFEGAEAPEGLDDFESAVDPKGTDGPAGTGDPENMDDPESPDDFEGSEDSESPEGPVPE